MEIGLPIYRGRRDKLALELLERATDEQGGCSVVGGVVELVGGPWTLRN